MKKMDKNFLLKLHGYSTAINEDNFVSLLIKDSSSVFIDLGCGNGDFSLKCANKIKTNNIWGVEVVKEFSNNAREKGIKIIEADLNKKLPLESNYFDVVTSNQVIEHLIDLDIFVKEIHRILKPNGYAIISTENLSSWHNIFSLLLGYKPFSLNYSYRIQIGNPMAPYWRNVIKEKSMTHIRVLTPFAFKDLFEVYGFNIEKFLGGGYYPIPFKSLSRIISKIDPIHSHFITIKIRKRACSYIGRNYNQNTNRRELV